MELMSATRVFAFYDTLRCLVTVIHSNSKFLAYTRSHGHSNISPFNCTWRALPSCLHLPNSLNAGHAFGQL